MATPRDHEEARRIASDAGAILVRLRADHVPRTDGPWSLRNAGDRGGQDFIAAELARTFPHDAVLSEEAVDDPVRLRCDRVWIIDPLDGTREFGEPPREDWAVHVALWERLDGGAGAVGSTAGGEGVLTVGAVALPAVGQTYSTAAPPPPPPRHAGPPRIVVSRSRPPVQAMRVRDALDGQLVALGSAGAKAMAVVRGEAEAYVHAGGQYEWDSAAPVAVAAAAGLHVSRLDGRPLAYNQPNPYLPDLLICRPDLAEPILEALS